jgi:hypothetical protein
MKFASSKATLFILGLWLQAGAAPAATTPPRQDQAAPPPVPQECCGWPTGVPGANAIQLGPIKDKPGELAVLRFNPTRKPLAARVPTTQYCVKPSITVAAKAAWTTPFEVLLIDKAPAGGGGPGFNPIQVATPIPAGTTRELLASPPWCVNLPDTAPPPSWVVQTPFGSKAVVFKSDPKASPR